MNRLACIVCLCPLILLGGDTLRFRCARCVEECRRQDLDTAEGRREWAQLRARIARATNSIPRIRRAA